MSFFTDKISNVGLEGGAAFNILHESGNFFLTPARYLWNGKSVSRVLIPREEDGKLNLVGNLRGNSVPFFTEEKSGKETTPEKILKTGVSVILLIPGVILGSLFKGIAWVLHGDVRLAHHDFSIFKERYKNDPDKINQAMAVGRVVMRVREELSRPAGKKTDPQPLKEAFKGVPEGGATVVRVLNDLSGKHEIKRINADNSRLSENELIHHLIGVCVDAYLDNTWTIETCQKAIRGLRYDVALIQEENFNWKDTENITLWFKNHHLEMNV